MKKILIIAAVLGGLGLAYWLISPFFIDKRVSEDFPAEVPFEGGTKTVEVKHTGSFEGFDRVHYGSGDVSLIKTPEGHVVRFEENFNVANGPDLFVGFGKDGEYVKGSEIGRLKGNIGSQNYTVPEDINLEEYDEVWVWCRAFSVGFAKAKFREI